MATMWHARIPLAVVVALALAVLPVRAQGRATAPGTESVRNDPRTSDWLEVAIARAAREHAGAMTRSTTASVASGGECARRVVLLTVAGAAVGVISAGVLLASTGGSDDTSGILTRWTLVGTAAGAAVGALTCLAP
jgi:hypothetical protein